MKLSAHCTLGTGGDAEHFVRVDSENALEDVLIEADHEAWPVTVLGGGSNVVIGDAGVDGLVVQMGIGGITRKADVYTIGAGVAWDTVVAQTLADGFCGLETLSGIPGSAGATPIQNVGAYGREISEFLHRVRAFDREMDTFVWLSPAELGLAYRTSILKRRSRYIVTAIELRLGTEALPIRYAELARALGVAEGESAPASETRTCVLALRQKKGMVLDPNDSDTRSVGSFFTNPIVVATSAVPGPRFLQPDGRVKLAAGWLVEQAGCVKGFQLGRARLSTKHALAITNTGGASSEEILALARHVRDAVDERFGVVLEPEAVMLGCTL